MNKIARKPALTSSDALEAINQSLGRCLLKDDAPDPKSDRLEYLIVGEDRGQEDDPRREPLATCLPQYLKAAELRHINVEDRYVRAFSADVPKSGRAVSRRCTDQEFGLGTDQLVQPAKDERVIVSQRHRPLPRGREGLHSQVGFIAKAGLSRWR